MGLLLWIICGVVALVVFFKIRGGVRETATTTNALLAEHYLELVELIPENTFSSQLQSRVLKILQAGGRLDSANSIEMFNRQSRFHQLNIVALALNEMDFPPRVPGEIWHEVSNPFITSEDTPHLEASAHRLSKKAGKIIQLKAAPMKMTQTSLID